MSEPIDATIYKAMFRQTQEEWEQLYLNQSVPISIEDRHRMARDLIEWGLELLDGEWPRKAELEFLTKRS